VSDVDVCVVGSFMMDFIVRAPRRPATGETLIGHSLETCLGGKGYNQAVAAARSGARTAMIGRLGSDEWGGQFRRSLEAEGIDATGTSTDAILGTGVGLPLVEDDGANSIVVIPRANLAMTEADVKAAATLLSSAAVVLLQLELPLNVAVAAARIAKRAGAIVILNPAPAVAPLEAFAGLVDLVVPNQSEATILIGAPCEGEDALRAAAKLQAVTGARDIVLTLGEHGALVIQGDRSELLAAHDVPCIDTVGAGDAFCGALAARLAAGDPLIEAARFGGAAGALAVTRPGAGPSMPTRAEIQGLLTDGFLATSGARDGKS